MGLAPLLRFSRKAGLAAGILLTFALSALLSSIAAANQAPPTLSGDEAAARLKFFHPSPESPEPFDFRWDSFTSLTTQQTGSEVLVLGEGSGFAGQPMIALATIEYDSARSYQLCRNDACFGADWRFRTATMAPLKNGAAFANEEAGGGVWLGFAGATPGQPIFYEDSDGVRKSVVPQTSAGIITLPDATTEFVNAWQEE